VEWSGSSGKNACLASHEALSSNPNAAKKINKGRISLRAGSITQTVEHKTLSSNTNTTKKFF
jgi:hypothetical protein